MKSLVNFNEVTNGDRCTITCKFLLGSFRWSYYMELLKHLMHLHQSVGIAGAHIYIESLLVIE